ncbi:DUF2867 domain-containing protein [Pseudomonas sp.]|uniref:DUF2867 domain-containing protein n=1 Tax=Pseudomonas sp. TaxID=306 RepID=UPI002734CD7D|nr:DUF2867 domain-containing protein [Pseudomonas sp.]MDP2746693.1 DUF2867 domain-containing protein [Pseudomonas sp.]
MNAPQNSILQGSLESAYFWDSHSARTKYNKQSALDFYIAVAKSTPSWVVQLMSLRNWVVSKLGLKDLGGINEFNHGESSETYKIGDVVGIFKLAENLENEVILEDRDKHLDVRVSFLVEPDGEYAVVHVTTVVHVNNVLGKIYMFFVAPPAQSNCS